MSAPFDRCNLNELPWTLVVAHGGEGQIRFHRVADDDATSGACHFIDLAEIPPGGSIGRHAHTDHEEEFYLVLSGSGDMWRDGELFPVRAGDFVRNRPGGAHGLVNSGAVPLRIFVFEVRVP